MRTPSLRILTVAIIAAVLTASPSFAECYGDSAYKVCTDSYTESNGDYHVRSYDNLGNSYSLETEQRSFGTNGQEVRSTDSLGNTYSIRTWTDAAGTHSVDSMGNRCTITTTGRMIGCGQ